MLFYCLFADCLRESAERLPTVFIILNVMNTIVLNKMRG